MTTLHKRRQWRAKRKQPTLADLAAAEWMIGVHCALAAFFTALIILVALFGSEFVNILFWW